VRGAAALVFQRRSVGPLTKATQRKSNGKKASRDFSQHIGHSFLQIAVRAKDGLTASFQKINKTWKIEHDCRDRQYIGNPLVTNHWINCFPA